VTNDWKDVGASFGIKLGGLWPLETTTQGTTTKSSCPCGEDSNEGEGRREGERKREGESARERKTERKKYEQKSRDEETFPTSWGRSDKSSDKLTGRNDRTNKNKTLIDRAANKDWIEQRNQDKTQMSTDVEGTFLAVETDP